MNKSKSNKGVLWPASGLNTKWHCASVLSSCSVCVCTIARRAVVLASQGAHNCWSCAQILQPRCLCSVTEGALLFTQSGDVFICASIQQSGPASIVRYLGEAWVNASRNQLTWLASEREPLFFHVIIHSVMFNWATWTRWQDSLTVAALCLQQTLSGGQLQPPQDLHLGCEYRAVRQSGLTVTSLSYVLVGKKFVYSIKGPILHKNHFTGVSNNNLSLVPQQNPPFTCFCFPLFSVC